MAFGPVFRALNSDYAFLYLPAVIYGYLFFVMTPQSMDLLLATVSSHLLFQIAIIICIIGALIYHQIFRLIFGDGGPSKNPKKTIIVLKHMITILTYCDIRDAQNDLIDVVWTTIDRFSRRNAIRLAVFGTPAIAMYILTYTAIIPLYQVVSSGQPDSFVGGALLIALLISLIQPRVWGFFPNFVPENAAEHIWTPEYKRGAEKAEATIDSTQRSIDEEWG